MFFLGSCSHLLGSSKLDLDLTRALFLGFWDFGVLGVVTFAWEFPAFCQERFFPLIILLFFFGGCIVLSFLVVYNSNYFSIYRDLILSTPLDKTPNN